MSLDTSVNSLALVYYATLEAIALQTRHIVEALNAAPTAGSSAKHEIKYLFLSGGLVKNTLLMQLLADTCDMPVVLPYSPSASVVLGAAMLGAAAAESTKPNGQGLWDIMASWPLFG